MIILALTYVASYIVINVFHIIPSAGYFAQDASNYSKVLTKHAFGSKIIKKYGGV